MTQQYFGLFFKTCAQPRTSSSSSSRLPSTPGNPTPLSVLSQVPEGPDQNVQTPPSALTRKSSAVDSADPTWTADAALGLRAIHRIPPTAGGDGETDALLVGGHSSGDENVVGVGAAAKPPGAGTKGRRELSFWGFAKQLATHGNFWL